MSYNRTFLFLTISNRLDENPSTPIGLVCKELRISRRTAQDVVKAQTGKSFSALRYEILTKKARQLFTSQPNLAIKEVSFALGFRHPRSFGRALKRASGFSPEKMRSLVTHYR